MKKITYLLMMLLMIFSEGLYSQVSINETFATTTTPTNWNVGTGGLSTTQSCATASWRRNVYSGTTGGILTTPAWTSNAQPLTISFKYKVVNWSAATVATSPYNGTITTEVSTDGGTTWTVVAGTINSANHVVANTCATVSYTVLGASLPTGNSTRVRMNAVWGTSGDYYVYIDDVVLSQASVVPPNCAISHLPADLATGVAKNPTLSWATGGGAPTSYDVYFGTTTSPALVGNQVGTTYAPAALASNTTYYWRVVPKNANGDAVGGCTERSFTTGILSCNPSSTNNATYINNFSTTLGTTNVSNLTSGYATGGYQNNYATQTVTSYDAGSFNFNMTVVGGTLGVAIWIDWNLNGVFDDATEKVFVTTGYGSGPFTGTINVPSGTALGDYAMRVMVDFNNSAPSNPCMTANARTETEDYKVTIGAPPACFAPTALNSSAITSNTATISWTASSSAPTSGYDYYFSTTNTAPIGTTTPSGNVLAGITTANFSGLLAQTTYYYWVRSNCGSSTYSSWTAGASFTTACIVVTSFSENFDTVTTPALPSCWAKVGTSGTLNTQSTSSSSTPNTLYLYSSSTTNVAMVKLPEVSNLGDGTHRLKLKLRANFTVGGIIEFGYLTNPTDASTFVSLGSATANSTTVYQDVIFTPVAGAYSTSPAIRGTGAPANSMLIDDVVWEVLPTCFVPSGLTASGLTATSANVSWTAPTSGTTPIGYEYAVTTSATPPASGTAVSGTSVTVSTLSASTTYYLHVRSECVALTDYSGWATSTSFTTPCAAISTLPWNEGFENAGAIPACWNQSSTNTENWLFGTGTGSTYGAAADHTTGTGYFAWIDDSTPDNANPSGLESPAFDFTSVGNPEMTFWFQNYRASGTAYSDLYVDVFDGTTWINGVFSIVDTQVNAWTQYTVNLSPYISANTRVRFRAIEELAGAYQSDISLDDIQIYAAPTDTPDFVNLQWPASTTILAGNNSEDIYARVFEGGLTNTTSGQAPGIVAWIGISPIGATAASNPNTWTMWVPATFSGEVDNGFGDLTANDEYKANIGSTLLAGTYRYASRFQLNGGPFVYGGFNGGAWQEAVNDSGVLTVNANPTQCATVVAPANAATNTQINGGGVLISWTAPTSGPAPTSYDVYHGTTSGTLTLLGNLPAPATAVNITGLAFNTQYFWRIVPKSTAGGDATGCTEWSYTTQANPFAAYCASVPTSNDGSGVTNVNLGGVSHQIFDVTYAIQNTPVALTANAVSNFSVTFATGFTYDTHVWIDFDNNNVFDTSEKVYTGVSLATNPTTLNGTFTIPASVLTGQYKMRIGTADSGQATPDPCYNGSFGVTLDFLANITGICATTATYNGSWDVTPTASTALVFASAYTHPDASTLEGCSCTINGAFAVNFPAGSLNITHNLVVPAGASLVFENDANFVQQTQTTANPLNVPNNVQGTFTSKRNSTPMILLDYTGWSSPVVGQNLKAFSPETLTNRFYAYNPTTNAYEAAIATGMEATTNFAAGKGYLIRAKNTASTTIPEAHNGTFTGTPNNGNLTLPVLGGYNLIGNPYASPIDAYQFLNNGTNNGLGMTTLYFWTHENPATSGTYLTNNYASHNGTGGTPATPIGVEPDGIIQVGQGFFVDVTSNGSAEFNNDMRLATSNGQFFKTTGELNQPTTIERHRMWFGLTSPNNYHNVALVGYVQGATNGVDPSFDAKLFSQSNSVIYSPMSNSKYVIQGRVLPFTATDIVPLGLIAQTTGQYTITMTNFDGLFTSQDVYLRDNLLNVTHDIKGSAYTFVSDAGQFDSRFEIVYAGPLAVETPTFTENSVVVFSNESGININAGQTIIDNVKVFDVRGRLLVSKSKVNANSINIENVTTEKQVLIVQITSSDNVTVSKKVIN